MQYFHEERFNNKMPVPWKKCLLKCLQYVKINRRIVFRRNHRDLKANFHSSVRRNIYDLQT